MSEHSAQELVSVAVTQTPELARKPAVPKPNAITKPGDLATQLVRPVPNAASTVKPKEAPRVASMPKDANVEVEEFFEGVIDEIGDEAIRMRTTSSEGEQGIAWLPFEKLPASEQKYVELGAPIRVSIVMRRDGTNTREHQIRVLRPNQWRQVEPSESAIDSLWKRMKAALR
jgi:hypothetical protein